MTRPNFEASLDTQLLHRALTGVPTGGEITYAALSEVVGRKIEGADSNLQSAIRLALNESEMVFANVRGVGYRRLTDIEIISASGRDTDGLRRKVKKSARKLTMVNDLAALPGEKRIEHNARLSLFAAIASITKPKSIDAIKSEVERVGSELPLAKTLEAFRRPASAA